MREQHGAAVDFQLCIAQCAAHTKTCECRTDSAHKDAFGRSALDNKSRDQYSLSGVDKSSRRQVHKLSPRLGWLGIVHLDKRHAVAAVRWRPPVG